MLRLNRARARGAHSGGAWGTKLYVATLLGALLVTACGKPLAKPECEALLLHYVTLLAASDRPETSSAERAHMLEKAKEKAALDPEMARCGSSVSRAQFNCAMVAPSTDEFERCLM